MTRLWAIWMLAPTHHSKVCCGTKSPSWNRLSAKAAGVGVAVGDGVGATVGVGVGVGVAVGAGRTVVAGVAVGAAVVTAGAGSAAEPAWHPTSSAATTRIWSARRVIAPAIIVAGKAPGKPQAPRTVDLGANARYSPVMRRLIVIAFG